MQYVYNFEKKPEMVLRNVVYLGLQFQVNRGEIF